MISHNVFRFTKAWWTKFFYFFFCFQVFLEIVLSNQHIIVRCIDFLAKTSKNGVIHTIYMRQSVPTSYNLGSSSNTKPARRLRTSYIFFLYFSISKPLRVPSVRDFRKHDGTYHKCNIHWPLCIHERKWDNWVWTCWYLCIEFLPAHLCVPVSWWNDSTILFHESSSPLIRVFWIFAFVGKIRSSPSSVPTTSLSSAELCHLYLYTLMFFFVFPVPRHFLRLYTISVSWRLTVVLLGEKEPTTNLK